MKKAVITLALTLLPVLMGAQTFIGAFYDANTRQVGQQVRYESLIIFPTTLNLGMRNQVDYTTLDVTIGGMIGDDDFWMSSSIGVAHNLKHYEGGSLSGTGLIAFNKRISEGFGVMVQYQATLNNNLYPETWLHQFGIGIYIE